MFNKILYLKSVGFFSLIRIFYLQFIRNILGVEKIFFKTVYKTNYPIFKWDDQGASLFVKKYFAEWGIEHFFLFTLNGRKKSVFLDIGCHTGYFATLYANFFNKIVGFEPSSKCQIVLKEIKKNYKNFSYFNYFIGDKIDKKVYSQQYENGFAFFDGGQTHNNFKAKKYKKKIIKHTYIDKLISKKFKNDNISAIKIDVDGLDVEVLKGSINTIKKHQPSIMIECQPKQLKEFLLIMKKLNYISYTFISSLKRPYDIKLVKVTSSNIDFYTNFVCVPNKFIPKKLYKKEIKGNIFFGINYKKLIKEFQLDNFTF